MTAAAASERVAVARRRRVPRQLASPVLWGPLILLVVVLSAWQLGVFHAIFGFKTFTVPYPSAIVAAIGDESPELVQAVGLTLPAAVAGYVAGTALGFAVASLLVLASPTAAARVISVLSSANALPIAAIAPLLALWVGAGFHLKVIVVTIMTIPSMIVYATRGLTSVPKPALELLESLEASKATVFLTVRVPTALPYVLTAMRSCVVLALIGTIVSEVVTGFEGLGFVIVESLGAFRTVTGWLALLIIAALGISWYLLVELVERIVIPWEGASRQAR